MIVPRSCRRIPTEKRPAGRCHATHIEAAMQVQESLELRLQSSNGKSLHDSTSRLSFHFHFLAESHTLACLGGWLVSALDHANPRDCELARLLHLCRHQRGQTL